MPVLRSLGQAGHFLLQALHDHGDIVDRLLHLLVVALISLGNQFVDLARRDLGQNAVAFANRQQDGIQHFVDPLHHLAIDSIKLVNLAALGETAIPGRVHQSHDLLRNELHFSVSRLLDAAMSIPDSARTFPQPSSFVYNFC